MSAFFVARFFVVVAFLVARAGFVADVLCPCSGCAVGSVLSVPVLAGVSGVSDEVAVFFAEARFVRAGLVGPEMVDVGDPFSASTVFDGAGGV